MYIITAERNSKYVRSSTGKWAFFHPGVNDNVWKFYRNKQEADVALLDIKELPVVQGMTVRVEEYK